MKRILITGAALDHIYVTVLLKKVILLLAWIISLRFKKYRTPVQIENFEFYHHDITKFVHVPGQLDYILHFASPASPIDYLKFQFKH
jgi:dTDP-glucose 4,6-dehydratase